ncbi:unnamed protein product, partial [Ectocarpus fasciculatus]
PGFLDSQDVKSLLWRALLCIYQHQQNRVAKGLKISLQPPHPSSARALIQPKSTRINHLPRISSPLRTSPPSKATPPSALHKTPSSALCGIYTIPSHTIPYHIPLATRNTPSHPHPRQCSNS